MLPPPIAASADLSPKRAPANTAGASAAAARMGAFLFFSPRVANEGISWVSRRRDAAVPHALTALRPRAAEADEAQLVLLAHLRALPGQRDPEHAAREVGRERHEATAGVTRGDFAAIDGRGGLGAPDVAILRARRVPDALGRELEDVLELAGRERARRPVDDGLRGGGNGGGRRGQRDDEGTKHVDGSSRYVGEWLSDTGAVLEFENEIEGIRINGVDIIAFSADGTQITRFKVMIRPLKAINLVHRLMAEELARG